MQDAKGITKQQGDNEIIKRKQEEVLNELNLL